MTQNRRFRHVWTFQNTPPINFKFVNENKQQTHIARRCLWARCATIAHWSRGRRDPDEAACCPWTGPVLATGTSGLCPPEGQPAPSPPTSSQTTSIYSHSKKSDGRRSSMFFFIVIIIEHWMVSFQPMLARAENATTVVGSSCVIGKCFVLCTCRQCCVTGCTSWQEKRALCSEPARRLTLRR